RLLNDGPITISLDSRKCDYDPEEQFEQIGSKKALREHTRLFGKKKEESS
ncbi:hypothetical protein KIPB_003104, partial [Kipferlia bialata]